MCCFAVCVCLCIDGCRTAHVRGDASETDEGFPLPPKGSPEEAELRARTADNINPAVVVFGFLTVCAIALISYLVWHHKEMSKLPRKPQRKLGVKKRRKIEARNADL